MNTYDVVIVGGSFAGLSAALQLGRARRTVFVIDAGENRNRFAHAANGLLGHDGKPPAEILASARRQLERYTTVSLQSARATTVQHAPGGFTVETSTGETATARRIILATGVTDSLPNIPGMREHWGTSVFHCPYCHGFEVGDQRLAVIANHAMAAHQVTMLRDWSDRLTLFTNGWDLEIEANAGFAIETRPIAELIGPAGNLQGVRLVDGGEIAIDAIFTQPMSTLSNDIATQLGCETTETMLGSRIVVSDKQETSVVNVFAAGDATRMASNLASAIADGAMAALAAHQTLMFANVGR